jgi:hypothetical protein
MSELCCICEIIKASDALVIGRLFMNISFDALWTRLVGTATDFRCNRQTPVAVITAPR